MVKKKETPDQKIESLHSCIELLEERENELKSRLEVLSARLHDASKKIAFLENYVNSMLNMSIWGKIQFLFKTKGDHK